MERIARADVRSGVKKSCSIYIDLRISILEQEEEEMKLTTDIFSTFDQVWALVTAGTPDSFNTMTISWGGMGTIWNKPVATVYIRSTRYTHEFIDANEYFTISFYPDEYKEKLSVLGSKSGREMDKMHDSGLTPKFFDKGITFEEAKYTLVCRKLFKQQLAVENIPEDVVNTYYLKEAPHDMYIAEVVEIRT